MVLVFKYSVGGMVSWEASWWVWRRGLLGLRGILEQMDKRIAEFREDFNRRLNHLESELRDLRSELMELRRDLNHRFFWLLGVQISMWITIILAILLK